MHDGKDERNSIRARGVLHRGLANVLLFSLLDQEYGRRLKKSCI